MQRSFVDKIWRRVAAGAQVKYAGRSCDWMPLSVRAGNHLSRQGLSSIDVGLLSLITEEFLAIPNLGKGTLEEIRQECRRITGS